MKKLRVNIVSESEISVQGHGVHTAYIEMAAALEKRDDVVLTRGGFGQTLNVDIVHLHTIGPRTWRKLFQPGAKKVVSAHVVPASLVGSIVGAKYWLFLVRWYMRWFYNRADKVLAVSATVAQILHDELHVPKEKIELFYNTIDMSHYVHGPADKAAARKALNAAADDFIVLGNGQVQPRKRLDVFIAMAKALPDVTFIWVGGIPFKQLGADYAHMQRLIHSVPANMTITGVIPHEKVREYLFAADVFCLPAEQENHPMCVLEAAGAGLPIILRNIPEYDDTFAGDALLCDDEGFIGAVKKLRADAAFYKRQQQASARIAKRFDAQAAAARLVKLYAQLAAK
jgi:1,2-diacylglycerol-3-alpha-glucose alpha-1,2-galactosyltransferase